VEVSPLQPAQFERAVALWHEVGLTRSWNDPDADLRRAVDGPASTILAGFEHGQLLATAMVGHDGHRGWVYYLAVERSARRRGHGRQMIRACEAWLTERGIPKLNLMVRSGDDDCVLAFYESLGYAPDDVVVLGRRLSA
jgi:ribosomal protein S18 acetylase RimI-like enzyme